MLHKKLKEHDPHEEDHSDDEKEEHHHDEHSSHAHQHGQVELSNGTHFKFNIFKHYPRHGQPYHMHAVRISTAQGMREMSFYHDGAEHMDVDKSDPNAWIYNDKRKMSFPCKGVKPLEAAHDDDDSPTHQSTHPKPSAPPLSPDHHSSEKGAPPSYDHAVGGHTMFGEASERRKQLRERLVQTAKETPEDTDCCGCRCS